MTVTTSAPTLQACLQFLAGNDTDRAQTVNGVGFSKFDGDFGHKLSMIPDDRMSPKQKRAAWVMLRKYRGQLGGAGIDFDALPEPPNVTEEVQAAYEAARARSRGESNGPRREMTRPNPQAPFLYVRFPYAQELLAELKFAFAGQLRWQADQKVWRLAMPSTPEDYRKLITWADRFGFILAADVRAYLELQARAGDKRREASRAASTDWQGPELLRQLYPFQRAGVQYIVEHAAGRGMICDEMGLGKSIQSIASIHALNAYPCLMITKATTKFAMRNEWIATVPGVRVHVAGSKWDDEAARGAQVIVINYDLVTKHLDSMLALPMQSLIVDESHRCKSHTAQRTQSIKALATGKKRIAKGKYETVRAGLPVRILLTGTPIINRPSEMISQLEILGRLDDLGGFNQFRSRYCNLQDDGYRVVEGKASDRAVAELNHRLRAICYVQRDKAQVAPELPAIQRSILPVELPREFRAEYNKAERDVVTYVGDRAIAQAHFMADIDHLEGEARSEAIRDWRNTAENRAARAQTIVMINHCKQIAGRAKVEAAKEWIADFLETGQKLIVFARHIEVQKAILAEFPNAVHILGEDGAHERQGAVSRFQNDPAMPMIVCATEAASEGVTLTAASNVLFLELEWTPAAHLQAEARCYGRINDLHGASSYYLIAQDTIDESMMGLLAAKMAVCDALTSGDDKARAAGESTLADLVEMLAKKGGK